LKKKLSRQEIRDVFKRNRGSQQDLVFRLQNDGTGRPMSKMTVSLWMAGKLTSKRIAKAAEAYAYELMAFEKRVDSVMGPPTTIGAGDGRR
jgi:arginine repressor